MNKIQNAVIAKAVTISNTNTLRKEAQANGIGLMNGSFVSTKLSVEGLRKSVACLSGKAGMTLGKAVAVLIGDKGRGVNVFEVRHSMEHGAIVFADGSVIHENLIETEVMAHGEFARRVLANATLKSVMLGGETVDGYVFSDSGFTADTLFSRDTKYSMFVYALGGKLVMDRRENAKNCYNQTKDLLVVAGDAQESDVTALLDAMASGEGESEGEGESKSERRNRLRREGRARAKAEAEAEAN